MNPLVLSLILMTKRSEVSKSDRNIPESLIPELSKEVIGMNKKLKKFAGMGAMIIGVLLTWEAASEANMMLMCECICLTFIGMFYTFPITENIKRVMQENRKTKASKANKTDESLNII